LLCYRVYGKEKIIILQITQDVAFTAGLSVNAPAPVQITGHVPRSFQGHFNMSPKSSTEKRNQWTEKYTEIYYIFH